MSVAAAAAVAGVVQVHESERVDLVHGSVCGTLCQVLEDALEDSDALEDGCQQQCSPGMGCHVDMLPNAGSEKPL